MAATRAGAPALLLAVHDEARNVRVAKWFTALWGCFAICFALFVSFQENLIEGLNIVASIFYPTLLGLFIVAFFFKQSIAIFCCFALGKRGIHSGNCSFGAMFVNERRPVHECFHHF